MQTPVAAFHCPTRRAPITYPWGITGNLVYLNLSNAGVSQPQMLAQCDYAASAGQTHRSVNTATPASYVDAEGWTADQWLWASIADPRFVLGVVYTHSKCCLTDITDGTTNTYLAGEKYMDPDHYATSLDYGTDQTWNHGCDWDVIRVTKIAADYYPPMQDQPGYSIYTSFGSAHSASFNMALCDGSVHAISYSIDKDVHNWLGSRNDGNVIDAKSY